MGGASRLLTTPFPLLLLLHRRPRPNPGLLRLACHSHSLSSPPPPLLVTPHRLTLSPTPRPRLCSPLEASQRKIHTQTSTIREDDRREFFPNSHHPWPEWSKLIHSLSSAGYFDHEREADDDDEFVAYQELPDEFARASRACLAFARHRSDLLGLLSRRDIGMIVENGTAFLFKSALDTSRRMRAFLGVGAGNALESDKARTVDLMKYLLSYASKPTVSSERGSLNRGELIESAVRNLLSELARPYGVSAPEPSASVQHQFLDKYGQTPRPIGQNIEMKRGDWICARCNFMNFARNIKCLECEEARPKRQLTGGEWECPQCDFFNYGRNQVCLRCDCKRPGEASVGTINSVSGYGNGVYANNPDIESRLAANDEKAQRWFSKVSQMSSASDLSSAAVDQDFPEIMPLRKGVNRFVVSTRKTPLERRLANSQYQKSLGNDNRADNLTTPMGRSLDEILGRTSAVSDAGKKNFAADGQNIGTERPPSPSSFGLPKGSNSSYAPFVPLPTDMFAKNPQKIEDGEKVVTETKDSFSLRASEQTSSVPVSSEIGKPLDSSYGYKEKEQAEKSETWFRKVSELYDSTDSATAIPDDDFPEIMPMRKGENRFVVSKKKDRSLTSPMYKRRMAMEQTGSANFVPFVPFPPDYFAKKDKQNPDGEISSKSTTPEKLDDNRPGASISQAQITENQQTSSGKLSLETSGEIFTDRKSGISYGSPISGNSTKDSFNSQNKNQDGGSTGFLGKESRIESSNLAGGSTQQPENQNLRSGWTGKSLEGSAVQEPDPLDMSEEAKAQRWFRRVAHIKDISELSNIPDEDFPSIMPMRKGVNRFVVSKRKTPLERRLTSPQYRRNLPIVSSDPVKKENENS